MNQEIENTLKKYLHAYYRQDFDTMLAILHEEDLVAYRNTFVDFAEKMDVFGETEDFLKKVKVKDLSTLKKMSVKDFMILIFKMVTKELGENEVKKMIKGTKIVHIDTAEVLTIVRYQIPLKMFGEWDMLESEVEMIFSDGEWKLLFKSGLSMVMQSFQKEIDLYYERKSRDKLENLGHESDLTTYTVVGFTNLNDEIVFEARFKDAGYFSNGLAYVQIMKKYGYINLKGDIAIKPRFLDARDFSEKRAAVQLSVGKSERLWGFINTRGKLIIEPQYEEVGEFNEGLCAVCKQEKWGFIDKKGQTKIPHQFFFAGDFENGEVEVEILNENDELITLMLDKKGNIVD